MKARGLNVVLLSPHLGTGLKQAALAASIISFMYDRHKVFQISVIIVADGWLRFRTMELSQYCASRKLQGIMSLMVVRKALLIALHQIPC